MALVLFWPVTDTSASGYGGPKRFDGNESRSDAMSVTANMPTKMPPTIVFHGTADTVVRKFSLFDSVNIRVGRGRKSLST